jgi:hypothetical protein
VEDAGQLYVELWVSLASLLRSYTAAHGLNGNRQATVELGEEKILVRHGGQWLELQRAGEKVSWTRENGSSGMLELTEAGRLRSIDPRSQSRDRGHPEMTDDGRLGSGVPTLSAKDAERMGHGESCWTEEEMDVMAEAWARELMR